MDLDSLRIVEVSRGRVVRWACVPYPGDLSPGAKEFSAFLKTSLADFHSAFRRASLWVVGPLPSLQVRFLSLPKTRPRQLSNLVYWTFRKEIPFDPQQTIFDYDVESDGFAPGPSRKTTEATAYTVGGEDVHAIVDLFAAAGFSVDGIVISSFALRNLFGVRPLAQAGPALGLYVGGNSSSLLFFKGKQVVAHRVFKTGMNVMLDVLRDRHPDWSPAKTYRAIRAALAAAPAPEPVAAEAARIAETVQVAFDRLIQQVERSMAAYLAGKGEEEIQNVYVAGSMAGLPVLVKELGAKLGLASSPLDLFQPGLLEANVPPPAGPEEAGMMAMALGAAFSDPAHTPNLLHTYVERAQAARRAAWRMAALVLGLVGLVLLAAAGGWVGQRNRCLRSELETIQAQIRQFAPYPDRAMIQAMVNEATVNSVQMKSMAGRSLPAAALNQLARGTPADIRLTSVVLDRDAGAKAAKKSKDTAVAEPKIRIQVQGMVLGPPGSQESKLASYVLRLEDAEMFERVSLNRSEEGREGGEQVLLFELDMKMDEVAGKPPPPAPAGKQGGTP
ncbi:MAG: hypothetical protein AB7V22_08005 [Kiritimatiellia bacterium]